MLIEHGSSLSHVAADATNRYRARTNDVERDDRVEYWTRAFGAIWGRIKPSPVGTRPFCGDLQSVRIATLRVNRISFEGMAFERLRSQPEEPFYSLAFPQRGKSVVFLGSDRLELLPGAVYLLDNSCLKTELCAPDIYETCNVQIPVSQLRDRLGTRYGSSHVKHSPALGLLKAIAHDLFQQASAIDLRSAAFIERQICDLAAFCLSGSEAAYSEDGVILAAQRERAEKYIERFHARTDLSPAGIATACHISESYLHKIFRGTGRTVMGRVREARLRAADDLLQRVSSRITVSEIAYRVGFKSLAEFSRAYKRRYGRSPNDARKLRFYAPETGMA